MFFQQVLLANILGFSGYREKALRQLSFSCEECIRECITSYFRLKHKLVHTIFEKQLFSLGEVLEKELHFYVYVNGEPTIPHK